MRALRREGEDTCKFSDGGAVDAYPAKRLYEEMSFIAYYFHWTEETVMDMPHLTRIKWSDQISRINRETDGSPPNIFEVH
jgi:hypothetical protein